MPELVESEYFRQLLLRLVADEYRERKGELLAPLGVTYIPAHVQKIPKSIYFSLHKEGHDFRLGYSQLTVFLFVVLSGRGRPRRKRNTKIAQGCVKTN